MSEKNDELTVSGRYRYNKDSKKYHRFQIETDEGITGSIYIPQTTEPLPKKLVLLYHKAE